MNLSFAPLVPGGARCYHQPHACDCAVLCCAASAGQVTWPMPMATWWVHSLTESHHLLSTADGHLWCRLTHNTIDASSNLCAHQRSIHKIASNAPNCARARSLPSQLSSLLCCPVLPHRLTGTTLASSLRLHSAAGPSWWQQVRT